MEGKKCKCSFSLFDWVEIKRGEKKHIFEMTKISISKNEKR